VDLLRDPVRRLAFPIADEWAQPNTQVEIPAEEIILTCTGGPLRWRVVPYDGVDQGSAPVNGDASTFDATIVKIRHDRQGNTTLSRTATTIDTEGAQANVGEDQTEEDVSAGDQVVISFVVAAQDSAAALWVFVDSGATVP